MKKMITIIFSILMIFSVFGCSVKNLKTENNQDIPKSFINTYLFLDYSKQFSNSVGEVTNYLLTKGYIDKEDKMKIGKIWKEQKKYQNILQTEVNRWYKDLNRGIYIEEKKVIYNLTKKIVTKTDLLVKILNEVKGEEIYIPKTLLSRIFNLYETIKEKE